jgi:hypothetical protein
MKLHQSRNQRKIAGLFPMLIASLLLMLGPVGCEKTTRISTAAAGHEITAVVSGDHSIDSQTDHGIISSPYGTVTIESSRMKLDDAPWTTIPVKSAVKVKISRGKVLLTAGNITVKRTVN